VTPKEKIAKLESLLARIKERARAPRTNGATAIATAFDEGEASEVKARAAVEEAAVHVEQAPPTVAATPSAKTTSAPPGLVDGSGWSEPPPTQADGMPDGMPDMDVEVSAEVVEIDIDDPGMMPAESGAQPVAEHVARAEPELEVTSEELLEAEPAPAAEQPTPPPANEIVEPAPSSSPRPIATEAAETYEEESAPRHTPPPESGKQVAAPSVKPEPRKSSIPPPSEGHTLLGGWREPGIALPTRDEGHKVPVRVPPPPPPPPPPPVAAAQPFRPEVTKPELPAEANVASFEGAAPAFAPATFGELLDATLSL